MSIPKYSSSYRLSSTFLKKRTSYFVTFELFQPHPLAFMCKTLKSKNYIRVPSNSFKYSELTVLLSPGELLLIIIIKC